MSIARFFAHLFVVTASVMCHGFGCAAVTTTGAMPPIKQSFEMKLSPSGRWVASLELVEGRNRVRLIERMSGLAMWLPVGLQDSPFWFSWSTAKDELLVSGIFSGTESFILVTPTELTPRPFMQALKISSEFVTPLNQYAYRYVRLENSRTNQAFDLGTDLSLSPVDPTSRNLMPAFGGGVGRARTRFNGSSVTWTIGADANATTETFDDADLRAGSSLVSIDEEGSLWFVSSAGANVLRLVKVDSVTGIHTVMSEGASDVAAVLLKPRTGKADAILRRDIDGPRWTAFGPESSRTIGELTLLGHGVPEILDRSADDQLWTVDFPYEGTPPGYYVYDRFTKSLEAIQLSSEAPKSSTAYHVERLRALSTDGVEIGGFRLYSDAKCGKKSCPFVVRLHGGPALQDDGRYSPNVAHLTDLGLNVIEVNYRGSKGYGKAFEEKDAGQWNTGIPDDVLRVLDKAYESSGSTVRATAFIGSSFSGYLALQMLTKTADARCAIVDSTFTDVTAFVQQQVDRFGSQADLIKRVADPSTPDGQKTLKEMSPINELDLFKGKRILQLHGGSDEIVPIALNKEFVKRMTLASRDFTYVSRAEWQHGLTSASAQLELQALTDRTLSQCLHLDMPIPPLPTGVKDMVIIGSPP